MKRYVLTGTSGSGKTSILRALECEGHPVVEEAAIDIIAHSAKMLKTGFQFSNPYIATWFCAATNTWPSAITGTTNFTAGPA
jgi:predicted ATPase